MKVMVARLTLAVALAVMPFPVLAQKTPQEVLRDSEAFQGLLPVNVDRKEGRLLLTLPPADAEGLSGRFIYVTALVTGLGSAALGLDRAKASGSRLLVFRRVGKKVLAEVEN